MPLARFAGASVENPVKTLLSVLFVLSCSWPAAHADDAATATVFVSMEGVTHELTSLNWQQSTVTLLDNEIRFYLTQDNHPVSLNFNLSQTDILEKGSAVYELPEANHGSAAIDLNFFNKNRESSRMKRRIVFNEGTIAIEELTPTSLRMTFKGAGNPLTDSGKFPIEGSVDVRFPDS